MWPISLVCPPIKRARLSFIGGRRPGDAEENGRFIFGLVRGDLEINEVKLINALGGGTIRAATDDEIIATGATPGYASPIGLTVAENLDAPGVFVIADTSA